VNARVPADEIEATDIHAPEVLERVRAFAPDLGLSLGAPILKPSLFSIPTRGTLNLHCGKVPEFRGAPPAFWELWYGATSVGATMHWVDAGLDTGAIVASADAPIYPADSLAEVEARVTELGSLVFRQALAAVIRGDASSRPQPTGGATHRFPTMSQRWKLSLRLASRRLRRRLAPRRLSKAAAMSASLYLYRPLRDVVRSLRRRHPVRVFTFHRVTWLCRDGMTVDPAAFRRQVAYIARHHDIVSLERDVALIREGARLQFGVTRSRRVQPAVAHFDDTVRVARIHVGVGDLHDGHALHGVLIAHRVRSLLGLGKAELQLPFIHQHSAGELDRLQRVQRFVASLRFDVLRDQLVDRHLFGFLR
jgi:folate-dependent phosphoribosylglycinamide formyltransferase PurN